MSYLKSISQNLETEVSDNMNPMIRTHKGCSSSCVYCQDASTPVSFRDIKDVISDIVKFKDRGFSTFKVIDPEINEDLEYLLDFCDALKVSGISMKWTANFKPTNYNKKLFRMMKNTGLESLRIRADSFRKCPLYWTDLEKIIFISKMNAIKIIVDFTTGFPYEKEEDIILCIDLFKKVRPDIVNLYPFIKLCPGLKITEIISKDDRLQTYVFRDISGDVFYNQLSIKNLKKMTSGDDLFRINMPGQFI